MTVGAIPAVAKSSYVEIGWNLWGTLPHFLPQRSLGIHLDRLTEMAKTMTPHLRRRREIRARAVRSLIRDPSPHGGRSAELVKATRPGS